MSLISVASDVVQQYLAFSRAVSCPQFFKNLFYFGFFSGRLFCVVWGFLVFFLYCFVSFCFNSVVSAVSKSRAVGS